jgi:hypothetical protein
MKVSVDAVQMGKSTMTRIRPPKWFWIITIGAIVWNGFGVAAYLSELSMTDEAFAALSDAEQSLYESRPMWVSVAFAVSVGAGLIGSILLALRHSYATAILGISAVAVVLQMIHLFVISDALNLMGARIAILPIAILIIAVSLVWVSITAQRRDWI